MTPIHVALIVMAPALAYFLVRWLFTKDQALEARRKAAAQLSSTLTAYGLDRLPRFLLDYATGDLVGMFDELHSLAQLFNESPQMVLQEFDQVFAHVLTHKLQTAEGRAFITAALAKTSAAPPASPS